MKLFKNIIFQFTLSTFLVIVFASLGLGFILSRNLASHALEQYLEVYPKLVESAVQTHPQILALFSATSPNSGQMEKSEKAFSDLLNFGTIFRLKVWSLDNTIVWSDDTEVIGNKFADNDDLILPKTGRIHYRLGAPYKRENASEKNSASILEIYVPIKDGGRTVGVIELYEDATELSGNLKKNRRIIWLFTTAAGVFIYLLLFLIFLNAHRRQRLGEEHLTHAQEVIISSLAYQAELRDMETGLHLERTSAYVRLLAESLQQHPLYKDYLSREYIEDLAKSSKLHDIGKVGIKDIILCKPGKLTAEEFDIMKKHCQHGADILKKAESQLSFRSFLAIAGQLTMHHHERWDGTGYPDGLRGEKIPFSARLMALADTYDALRSVRCYKSAFSHQRSMEIILENSGSHFDPTVVEAFLAQEKEFERISIELAG